MIVLDKNEAYDTSKLTVDELQQVIDAMKKEENWFEYRDAVCRRTHNPDINIAIYHKAGKRWFFSKDAESTKDARELFYIGGKEETSNYESILQEAERIINGARAEDYGDVTENFQKIADGWRVIFGVEVTPRQVGHAMIWLKTCRDLNTSKRDNLVDIAGYAGCIDKMKKTI